MEAVLEGHADSYPMGRWANQSPFFAHLPSWQNHLTPRISAVAVLGTQFSKSETKTCSLEIECWLTGEADCVGGSVAIPVSL